MTKNDENENSTGPIDRFDLIDDIAADYVSGRTRYGRFPSHDDRVSPENRAKVEAPLNVLSGVNLKQCDASRDLEFQKRVCEEVPRIEASIYDAIKKHMHIPKEAPKIQVEYIEMVAMLLHRAVENLAGDGEYRHYFYAGYSWRIDNGEITIAVTPASHGTVIDHWQRGVTLDEDVEEDERRSQWLDELEEECRKEPYSY